MSGVVGLRLQRERDQVPDLLVSDLTGSPGPGRVHQPVQSMGRNGPATWSRWGG